MANTIFSNDLILVEDIPAVTQASFQGLEPQYLTVKRITLSIFITIMLLSAGAIFFFNKPIQDWRIILGTSLIGFFFFISYWLADTWSFKYSGYAIREHDLMFRSGWWWRTLRIVPFNRAQHLSIESGLIERQFKLASVRIYTAGASQADFTLHGIKHEVAQKLKDWISTQMQEKTAEDKPKDDAAA